MNKIFSAIKKHKIISVIAAALLIYVSYSWYQKSKASTVKVQYLTAQAQKNTITVSVTGTGQVSEESKVDVKPGSSGALTSVNVKQGDSVKSGQVIAVVDERNAQLQLTQAKASVASAQASYDKLVGGITSTDQKIAQNSVDSAQAALDNAQAAYDNTVKQQQLAVSKAYSDLLNTGLTAQAATTNSSTATITLSGAYDGNQQGEYKISIFQTLDGFGFSLGGLENSGIITIKRGFAQPLGSHGLFINFGSAGTLASGDTWTIDLPNTQSSSYLAAQNAYQGALQSQTQALANAQQQIKSAQLNLAQAQDQYDSKVQPPANADIESAKAQIANAQGQLQQAQIAFDNNIIKAPFDGIVAALNNHVGDQVAASDVVATVITNQQIAQISLNEVDVSKIKVGDKATMTFDAIDGLSLTGTVAQIDTIGTVTQGVVTYSVKIAFDSQNDQIKPGMSVSAAIITDVATDVLTVPSSAVKSGNGGSFVQVLGSNGQPQNKNVQVGISNDTDTEITSGLSEGDSVITQTISTGSKSSAAAQSSASGLRIPGIGGGGGGNFGGAGRGGVGGGAARGN